MRIHCFNYGIHARDLILGWFPGCWISVTAFIFWLKRLGTAFAGGLMRFRYPYVISFCLEMMVDEWGVDFLVHFGYDLFIFRGEFFEVGVLNEVNVALSCFCMKESIRVIDHLGRFCISLWREHFLRIVSPFTWLWIEFVMWLRTWKAVSYTHLTLPTKRIV